jgi:hypothetical protein
MAIAKSCLFGHCTRIKAKKIGYAVEYYANAFPAKRHRDAAVFAADRPSNERDGSTASGTISEVFLAFKACRGSKRFSDDLFRLTLGGEQICLGRNSS